MRGKKRGNRRFCIRRIGCGKLEQAGLRHSLVPMGGSLCHSPLSSEPKEIELFIFLKWRFNQELLIPSAAIYPSVLSIGLKSFGCLKTKTTPSTALHTCHVLGLVLVTFSCCSRAPLNRQLIPNQKCIYWTSGKVQYQESDIY